MDLNLNGDHQKKMEDKNTKQKTKQASKWTTAKKPYIATKNIEIGYLLSICFCHFSGYFRRKELANYCN